MRASFGIKKLDEYLGGGLDRNTVNLITGRSGIGKTILASHWAAEGAKNDENVVFLLTTLNPKSCESYIGMFKFIKDVYNKIHWRFIDIDAKDLLPLTKDRLKEKMADYVGMDLKDVDRVVFDSSTSLDLVLADRALYRRAITYIAQMCYDNDVTAIFVEETPMISEWSETRFFAECVIFMDILRIPDGYIRALRILKKYRNSHPLEWIPYDITDNGIEIKEGRYVRADYEFKYRPD